MQFIGGEVTLFNLERIIKLLICNKVRKISIVTNFSKSTDYYLGLYNLLKQNGIILSLTASYHEEFSNFNTFIDKAIKINSILSSKHFTIEIVNTGKNKDTVIKMKNVCDSNNIYLRIDIDRTKDFESIDNSVKQKNIRKSNQVFYSDNTSAFYDGISSIISDSANKNSVEDNRIKCHLWYCSIGIKTILVQNRQVDLCREKVPLKDFKKLEKPVNCPKQNCSLCKIVTVCSSIYYTLQDALDFMR